MDRDWARSLLASSFIALIGVFGFSLAHAAEATTGSIVGVVLAGGVPVAQARVSAASPSGTYVATTNARGQFTLLGITPDSYTVAVQAPGYQPATQNGVVILPNQTQQLAFHLIAQLKTIASAQAHTHAFSTANTSDAFTVSGRAIGAPAVSAGLANYTAGTVQGAIASVPGVSYDQFANAILRGGKVDDAVFDFDSVPVPQGLIAEPGGNVVGAQLPSTGIATTTVTLAGYESQGDNALGGVVDEIPAVGTYPGSGRLELADGIAGAKMHLVDLQILGATPDQRWRYALAGTAGNESLSYGDGHTFYPSEAATYGLGLDSRSHYAFESNVHYRPREKDDLSLLVFNGQASYNQYGSPYPGLVFGAFDGSRTRYPGETNPNAPVTFPAGIRGSFDIFKLGWLHTGAHTLSRLQLYQSRFGASAGGPYWDENGFPDGTFSFFGQQSGRDLALAYDGDDFLGVRHHLQYGGEYRITRYTLDQVVPTFEEIVHSNPTLHSFLAYAGDTWNASSRLDLMGALRLTMTSISPSTGFSYAVGALDPHVSAAYRIGTAYSARATFDHTTVAPKPLEADRFDSTNVDQNGNAAPFVTLVPETANVYTASVEGSARTQFRLTYWAELEKNRIDVLPYNFRQSGGTLLASPIGVPTNVGELRAHGLELWLSRAGLTLNAEYVRAFSSSASQFAYNNLNAPAIAAGHLFPVGYIPDFTATLSYEFATASRRIRIEPSVSYESGYPYGVGKAAWVFDRNGRPAQVRNDNHVNPGSNYYFLRDPAQPYNAATNPYIGTLGTPEGNDPNTLRSPPQTLLNLHVEGDVSARFTAVLDVVNLLATAAPTTYGQNGYLIGPPGYAGGNPLYAAYYRNVIGSAQPYVLGNGVPTNDGLTQSVPWTYGRAGYIPYSYPAARNVQVRLRWRF